MLNAKCQGRTLRRGSAAARPPFNIYHLTFIIFVLALPGCGTWNRATQTRRDVYMNLMTPLQQAQYLHMEATERPVSLRLAYLQEIGVYQQWSEQPKSIQEAILRQQVVEGMTPLHVQMAWGLPDERSDETEPAERAAGHTKTVWEYRVRRSRTGPACQERSVCFFDDRVLWVRRIR
jgi:hypothetical protein